MMAARTLGIHRPGRAAATLIAAAIGLLLTSAPAGASTPAPAPAGAGLTSVVAADVLFWSRRPNADTSPTSIVKASAAAPALIATVIAGSDPEVSPDGSKLVYVRGGDTKAIEVRDLATGSTRVLASHTDGPVPPTGVLYYYGLFEPTWSPDGTTIAYVDTRSQNDEYAEVRTVPATGGTIRTVDPASIAAAWRPDGKLTVARLTSRTQPTTGLWVTGAAPADAVLIPGSAGAREHAWSPDGSQVVFSSYDFVSPSSLEILPAAGGTPTVLVPSTFQYDNVTPAWSSDGQQIYFSQADAGQPNPAARIMRIARTGGPLTTVVTGGANYSVSVTTKVAPPVASRSHDFNGDGYADVVGRRTTGELRVYFGNGLALSGSQAIGAGWGGMTAIFSPGDYNGDGRPDVIGRTSTGDLRLYFGTTTGGLSGYRVIGVGWGGFNALFSPGDFNGDGKPDVIGRTTTGDLRLYYGTGTALSGYSVIGRGWSGFNALLSPGDFNNDGKPDVIGRTSTGDLRVYYGYGNNLSGYRVIGTGFNGLNPLF